MHCTRCGTENPDASAYCFNCGRSMVASRGEPKTLAEKWAQTFRAEGGHWPEDGHWPEQWYAIEREMNRSGDVASSGGGGYENEKNEGGDLGTPYVFIDSSGFLLSGGDDKTFPAIRVFSEAEIAKLQGVWDRAAAIFNCAGSIDAPRRETAVAATSGAAGERAAIEASHFILQLTPWAAEFIKAKCSGAFAVGVLLGTFADDGCVSITRTVRVCAHTWIKKGIWQISPVALVGVQRWGREQGMDIVGFFEPHSENEGLEPLEADIVGAHWFGCSYVISDGKHISSRRLMGDDESNKHLVKESIVISGASQ